MKFENKLLLGSTLVLLVIQLVILGAKTVNRDMIALQKNGIIYTFGLFEVCKDVSTQTKACSDQIDNSTGLPSGTLKASVAGIAIATATSCIMLFFVAWRPIQLLAVLLNVNTFFWTTLSAGLWGISLKESAFQQVPGIGFSYVPGLGLSILLGTLIFSLMLIIFTGIYYTKNKRDYSDA